MIQIISGGKLLTCSFHSFQQLSLCPVALHGDPPILVSIDLFWLSCVSVHSLLAASRHPLHSLLPYPAFTPAKQGQICSSFGGVPVQVLLVLVDQETRKDPGNAQSVIGRAGSECLPCVHCFSCAHLPRSLSCHLTTVPNLSW